MSDGARGWCNGEGGGEGGADGGEVVVTWTALHRAEVGAMGNTGGCASSDAGGAAGDNQWPGQPADARTLAEKAECCTYRWPELPCRKAS